ncbi:hypothetical protein O3M35_003727 [Rhynocoris fuscipes]|uniref:Uncharacterized protein n=1 Tax=Rhynocoris fuscipes TaxID=488301 RepID=A0AAW1CNF7_9HEMI
MLNHFCAFSSVWIVLSSIYGSILVVLMLSFSLIEVLDNNVPILSLQGWYLLYLYVGSMAVIISIYVWLLINSCSSTPEARVSSTEFPQTRDVDVISFTSRFDSLRRLHISTKESSYCSFYLRFAAAAFGIGALVFNGLETALHSLMEHSCITELMFVHPILHGFFTFLQMHFLFLNSQVVVEKFGYIARFGFMHLASTNLALWIRLIIWESGLEFVYYIYLTMTENLPRSDVSYWPISQTHIKQVVKLHNCLSSNKLGQIWSSSMPFLYPFIAQFSIIAASVTYMMGKKIGIDNKNTRSNKIPNKFDLKGNSSRHDACDHDLCRKCEFDFNGSCKGLVLGIILIIIVAVIIIFVVVGKENDFCQYTLYIITSSTISALLLTNIIISITALIKIRRLYMTGRSLCDLDDNLSTLSLAGIQLYSVFSMLVAVYSLYDENVAISESNQLQYKLLLLLSVLQLIQSTIQSALIQEATRRSARPTRTSLIIRPAKQILTFLFCTNISLWALDTFVTQNWIVQELQLRYIGVLGWGVISRITLPLIMFYRFHSAALILQILQSAYNPCSFNPSMFL